MKKQIKIKHVSIGTIAVATIATPPAIVASLENDKFQELKDTIRKEVQDMAKTPPTLLDLSNTLKDVILEIKLNKANAKILEAKLDQAILLLTTINSKV